MENSNIFENIRATMKVENMEVTENSEKIIKDFLNNDILEEQAVKYIKQDILSRRNV
jgi:hypothetical protein